MICEPLPGALRAVTQSRIKELFNLSAKIGTDVRLFCNMAGPLADFQVPSHRLLNTDLESFQTSRRLRDQGHQPRHEAGLL